MNEKIDREIDAITKKEVEPKNVNTPSILAMNILTV